LVCALEHSIKLHDGHALAIVKSFEERDSQILGEFQGLFKQVESIPLLMKRKPASDINEQVFIIGKNDQWIKSLKEKGYFVINADMDEFVKKYSINAVPQLSIFDNKNNLLYSGGYTSKRGPASIVEDRLIYQELKEKQETSERPIFGCLNGSINRKNADPLKIKY
jgi:thioredoxin-related protein